jgi:hypothetical protein
MIPRPAYSKCNRLGGAIAVLGGAIAVPSVGVGQS